MSVLHEFDLLLADYLRVNVGRHLDSTEFSGHLAAKLPAELVEYIRTRADEDGHPGRNPSLLLSYDELNHLHGALSALPQRLLRKWHTYPTLHSRATLCTGEINRRLSAADADHWATVSSRLGGQLETEPELSEGVRIVQEWISELRWHLQAMGDQHLLPAPEGDSPTPTNPLPLVAPKSGLVKPTGVPLEPQSGESETAERESVRGDDPRPPDTPSALTAKCHRDEETRPAEPVLAESPSSGAEPTAANGEAADKSEEDTGKRLEALPKESPLDDREAYEDIMRGAINDLPDGRNAKPEELIRHAGANEKRARRALRELERRGEYEGHSRKPPARHRAGKKS